MHHNTHLLIGFIAFSLTASTYHFFLLCSRLFSPILCVLLCNLEKGMNMVNFEIRFKIRFLSELFFFPPHCSLASESLLGFY